MSTIAATVLLLSSAASLTSQQTTEVNRLEDSLLAPCCYSQSISRHMSPEAEQMRHEVTEMVASGRSENEILEHYKALYGERILIVPDARTGKVLFSLPVLAFLACSGMLFEFLRRMLKAKTDSPPSCVCALRTSFESLNIRTKRATVQLDALLLPT